MKRDQSRNVLIYACRCKENRKLYIGSTTNLANRIRQHNAHGNSYRDKIYVQDRAGWKLHEAMHQLGTENFEWYVLETDVPERRRYEREDFWISYYDSANPAKGYNVCNAKTHDLENMVRHCLPEQCSTLDSKKGELRELILTLTEEQIEAIYQLIRNE